MIELAKVPLLLIFVPSLVLILGASEFGHRLGLRTEAGSNLSTLEAAILGLRGHGAMLRTVTTARKHSVGGRAISRDRATTA
jgi:hypothetical protein